MIYYIHKVKENFKSKKRGMFYEYEQIKTYKERVRAVDS